MDESKKFPLCWTKQHAMKTYWGSGGIAPRMLDLGTRRRWVVSFTPRPLYPRERAPRTHWIGGWVGPRAVLETVIKRKIPSPRRESNSRRMNWFERNICAFATLVSKGQIYMLNVDKHNLWLSYHHYCLEVKYTFHAFFAQNVWKVRIRGTCPSVQTDERI
jgi:hypothetical protein